MINSGMTRVCSLLKSVHNYNYDNYSITQSVLVGNHNTNTLTLISEFSEKLMFIYARIA